MRVRVKEKASQRRITLKEMLKLLARRIKNRFVRLFETKRSKELEFQRSWKKYSWDYVMEKLEEYWKKYRYFDDIKNLVDFKNKRILDVGCGVISALNLISDAEKYGIDPLMNEYLKIYHLKKDIVWRQASGEAIPFEQDFFDIVFCSNVLDHVDDPRKTIAEIRRVLKPGGFLVLTVDTFSKRIKRNKAHPHTFIQEDIEKLMRGFDIRFMEKSEIGAQVLAYIRGEISVNDRREIILVASLSEALPCE